METIILIIHIAACLGLIGMVLLQTAKNSALSGLFGSGGSDSIFGGSGGNPFLRKVTTIFAIAFFSTSLVLALRAARQPRKSILEKAIPPSSMGMGSEQTSSNDSEKLPENKPASETK